MNTIASRFGPPAAAVLILLGLIAIVGDGALGLMTSYQDGREDIAAKQRQLRELVDLAQAREDFSRLMPKGKTALIASSSESAQDSLAKSVNQAIAGRQIILDGIDPLPAAVPARAKARVRLRSPQPDLLAYLQAIEAQVPYLLVSRLDVSVARPADPEAAKPLVLTADMQVEAPFAPAIPAIAPPSDAASPVP